MNRNGHEDVTDLPFRPSVGAPSGVAVLDFAGLLGRAHGHGVDAFAPLRPASHHLITVRSGALRCSLDFTDHTLSEGDWLWARPGQILRVRHRPRRSPGHRRALPFRLPRRPIRSRPPVSTSRPRRQPLGQILEREVPWSLSFVDVSDEPDPEAAGRAWIAADLARPMDLASGPLFSYALFRLAPDRFWWYHTYHHAAVDAFGYALVARRVAGGLHGPGPRGQGRPLSLRPVVRAGPGRPGLPRVPGACRGPCVLDAAVGGMDAPASGVLPPIRRTGPFRERTCFRCRARRY
ncbi:hypothetical protein SVIOM74S_05932 [Streptomyces violarus]